MSEARATAMHEAGHALAAHLEGVPIEKMDLGRYGGTPHVELGNYNPTSAKMITIGLAGSLAEQRTGAGYLGWGTSNSDDRLADRAREALLDRGQQAQIIAAQDRASEIIREYHDVLDALADALMRTDDGLIFGTDVRKVIRSALGRRRFLGSLSEWERLQEIQQRRTQMERAGIKPAKDVAAVASPGGWYAAKAFTAATGERVSKGEWAANGHALVDARPDCWTAAQVLPKDDPGSRRRIAFELAHRAVR